MARRRFRRWRPTGLIPLMGRGLRAALRLAGSPGLLLLALLLGLGWGVAAAARTADAFLVRQVRLPDGAAFTLPDPLIGRNIWTVDLRALSHALQAQHPSAKAILVLRRLPDTIHISILPRRPVAQVRLDGGQAGRWFPVDAEGFVLAEGATLPQERLVMLTGMERGAVRAGRASADERLRLALRVLARVRRSPAAVSRLVTEINVADPEQIRLTLDGSTEVRCGSEAELDAQLDRLRGALKAIARQPVDAGYIDLRFTEPVVGPRTAR